MAALPDDLSAAAVAAIRQRLDRVRGAGAKVLFAVESGIRAWGFPSPDSDYDCRFVYVRSVRDHIVLEQPRDVIEFPIEGEIDTGGWDLRKALLLALGGNAVVVEWANSPIVYEEIEGVRGRCSTFWGRSSIGPIPPAIAAYLEARYGHHEMNMPTSSKDEARRVRDRNLAEVFYHAQTGHA